ncbi:Mur ligase family protein [Rhizobiaceae bacterium BDR2-2]|uniref:Mur ligase family protein n=1 Tax=Ectorhizobium quercum TaxID=2965071 RepID=A0AAE3SSV8_9HYPH|nr:Mur ligase family protein [Ectorhizobium quercum]MCX8995495.1 Mur ligase family protein [Ectorhizobium quercum]
MDFSEKLKLARRKTVESLPAEKGVVRTVTLFFSVSDGEKRAQVVHASGFPFEAVWQKACLQLREIMAREGLTGKWLRIDWVEDVEAVTWKELRRRLTKIKRNYFRHGLALDPELRIAFLEQELNGNAMLYGGNAIAHAVVNEKNFSIYARRRFGEATDPDFSDDRPVYILSTGGLFVDEEGACQALGPAGPNGGRRHVEKLSAGDVRSLIENSSSFLARQVRDDGLFVYGYHPCFDRQIAAYNALRHASTTYSMIEAWEITRDPALKVAIDKALGALEERLIKPATLPDGTAAAFLVEANGEIKLGGNAVCLLALVKYSEVTGTRRYLDLLERLASGILYLQDPETGIFRHVIHYPGLEPKEDFRIIYYDGEAAFGLMRLYGLTGDARWLEAVEKAFGHFIRAEHWKAHDHWLGYCVNELTRVRPDEKYYRFGVSNIADHLDFVLERITTFPTLLELMMAARQMIARLQADDANRHLLDAIDLDKFHRALHARAHYLLNGHFWPELAMYFANPAGIAGSFFIRHHAFRVRIDDVEHYLSGFVAYLKYLEAEPGEAETTGEPPSVWTAAEMEQATGGTWAVKPPQGWSAGGICPYAPAYRPGDMVVSRAHGEAKGIPLRSLGDLRPKPAAVLATAMDPALDRLGIPVLTVADTKKAVLALGHHARGKIGGKVIGITGSAGKTTCVAMLAHVLQAWGSVEQSRENANLPFGVAWNLASFDRRTKHIVMELAVGRMGQSARMARPHVAIFTNVLPAHLSETSTIADIAATKGAIFSGMEPGGVAILNRDMLEWQTVLRLAQRRGLQVLHYGSAEDCDYRLLSYSPSEGRVHAAIGGRDVVYGIGAAGAHMALNSLAVLAAVSAIGYPLETALPMLRTFAALPGRGQEIALELDNRRLTVIDDAYNANPGSMQAAIERLDDEDASGRRIAVFGQMAELGPQAPHYHTELAAIVNRSRIDRVYAVGDLYAGFWELLSPGKRAAHVEEPEQLKAMLVEELCDGDTVLFKGSNSTRIHEVVAWLRGLE